MKLGRAGKSGKPREYFERTMLSPENFNGLSEDERSTYVDLVRKIWSEPLKLDILC
jgi:hypothetical protein